MYNGSYSVLYFSHKGREPPQFGLGKMGVEVVKERGIVEVPQERGGVVHFIVDTREESNVLGEVVVTENKGGGTEEDRG